MNSWLSQRGNLIRQNLRVARAKWGVNLSADGRRALRFYSEHFRISVERGDLLLIDGKERQARHGRDWPPGSGG